MSAPPEPPNPCSFQLTQSRNRATRVRPRNCGGAFFPIDPGTFSNRISFDSSKLTCGWYIYAIYENQHTDEARAFKPHHRQFWRVTVLVYLQFVHNGQLTSVTTTTTAASATHSGTVAYDMTVLSGPQCQTQLQPPPSASNSIRVDDWFVDTMAQDGGFFGFSIEMSVVNHVCHCFCGDD